MTFISDDPSSWPIIHSNILYGYWTVAASVIVVYDWTLTLGQEIELIWRQRWSLMTVLYLVIRYIGLPYSVPNVLPTIPLVSLTDAVSNIMYFAQNGTNVVVTAMLGVIMIARLHAMYQGSRKMFIFLVIIFLVVNIACGVIAVIGIKDTVAEEFILFGTYMCKYGSEGDVQILYTMVWTLNTIWEVLALCLSLWVAVKHFRDLRRLGPSIGSTTGDCFTVLTRSHVFYFVIFVCVSIIQFGADSSEIAGALQVLSVMQMFVLGPRLILSVRQYHAELVTKSDAETSMDLMNVCMYQLAVLCREMLAEWSAGRNLVQDPFVVFI
ncbi:uncharacterized protein HD556DRAFT_997675 [Suillus plorans]|uniref:DUF6533 domain-containing protein n=1 Tax=Suillus plorans TaxID=116603 RepID=A0A9P7AES8_9AGAM|nr:uncharacterized protein HD556DRAFT_997675 [Suillus plorans]KAG1786974.1 hypothetical protein HD556DRAFT_997675 [Suillus plorans]